MKKSELRELIREQVRNLIKEASVSQEAYTIHNITKCGQDAAQNFIDDNKLDGKKLAAYVRQHSNSKEKYEVRDIIAGTGVGANVGFKSRFVKQFKESVIKEAKELSLYKIGDEVKFSNGEIWKVAKPGVKGDKVFLAPFNAIAKKGHISLSIEFTQDELKDTVTESVLKEALIGPFAISASTPVDELQAMYQGALDGFSNYKTGMKFKKSEYKLAYQTIEKILQKKGVVIKEADDPEAGEAAPYGSGYSEVNEDAGMVIDVAMGVAVGLMGLWALVQSVPLVGRVFGDAAEYLATKSERKAKMALKNQRKETIAPIIAKFKNDNELKQMYQDLTPYSQGFNRKEILDNKVRKQQLIKIGKYIKSKLTPEETKYFTDVSAMLRDGDIKESVLKEEITLNSPSFKKLVAKVQEISDKSGNDWNELKKYLTSKYAFFETYTTGTNPAAYVVNFFAITKGKDADVKKKPQDYVEIGEWYIRPW